MYFFYLPVILGIEDEDFIITIRIMLHFFSDNSCQALTTNAYISWCGTQIISCSRSEVQHGYDILRSSSATANRLVHLISISAPVGDFNISLSTCQPAGVCFSGTKFSSTVKAINLPSTSFLFSSGWKLI